jgi:2',3'-cyclic-nucleotide 2'-phosphodiesterase (5'-nucleotidase family)
VSIAQPAEMVRKYLDEVRKKADVVVLLAELSVYDAHQLAKEIPGIDFVFGAYGGTYSSQEEVEGSTRIVFTGNQGKRVGETRAFLDDKSRVVSQESYLYFLTGRFPDDPDTLKWTRGTLAKMQPAGGAPASGAPAPAARGETAR